MVGYELGKLATTNDVASGFSTSTIMSTQRDSQLAMQQGFADVQQTLCQGFSGTDRTMLQGFHGVDTAVCNLGFGLQNAINGVSHQISDCCCGIKTELLNNRYVSEKQTCDILAGQNAQTQRILDYLTTEKVSALQAENSVLKNQLSQNAQTNTIISTLRPVAQPAYITCSPYESVYANRCACGCN